MHILINTLFVISAALLSVGTLVGIGYAVYLAGPGQMGMGMALWNGLLLWLKLMVTSAGCLVVGFLLGRRYGG